MWKFAIIPVFLLVSWIWQFLDWAWFKPKKIERFFRNQGMRGNSYKFLVGDSKEISHMYEIAYSKTLGLNDDITPRVMPDIHHAVQNYGNYSFTWSGPRPRVFIMDLDVARDGLYKHRDYLKTFKISNHILKLLVTGLPDLEGDEWVKSRSQLNPVFSLDKLRPMVPAFNVCAEGVVKELRELVSKDGGSTTINASPYMRLFTSAVLSQLMFGCTYTEEIKSVFLQLAELAGFAELASKPFRLPGEKYLPTKTNRRASEIDRNVKVAFRAMISERLKRGAPSGHRDLLDILIEPLYDGTSRKESERRRIIEDAIGQCKIFFFAGFETTSNLLTWTLINLAFHQDWQDRAREEAFQVLGDREDVTSDDLTKLKVLGMIINEILRLYPSSMEISRLMKEDTKVKDFIIPKDTLVTFPILMYQRDPKIWGEDASKFNPGRFAEGVVKAANGESAFMPFGWGPRICIGVNFTMLESKTVLARLLRKFSIEASPTYTHAPFVPLTVQPQYGAPVVLKKL